MPPPDQLITVEVRTWLAGAGLSVKGSYRVHEIARLLDVGHRTVYGMITRGDLDVLRINTGGQRCTPTRIPLSSVASLLHAPD